MKKLLYFLLIANSLWLTACSLSKQISKQANKSIFADSNFLPAHVGISIYDPSTNQYLYNYQGDKYFVPASNTKLLTCYAAMKHLGDSLVGLYYQNFSDTAINVFATGDPTFLHDDFKSQPVLTFLKNEKRKIYLGNTTGYYNKENHFNPLGRGWAWDDYESSYMAERSAFPIHGNTVAIKLDSYERLGKIAIKLNWKISPNYFKQFLDTMFVMPLKKLASYEMRDTSNILKTLLSFDIKRGKTNNQFTIDFGESKFRQTEMTYAANELATSTEILKNDFQIHNLRKGTLYDNDFYGGIPQHLEVHTIKTQPTDSLLKPMMHRSDNFFAEQSLLMVSNETLGYMSDTKIIDSLLQTDYKNMPQKPKWVDGSGLSRYNLITPQDFVFVLNKMKQDFSWERITTILPTGNEGTLAGLYKNHIGKIYAKTGTLSNNVALSGFITTNKGKQLIFSILVNNHQTSASNIRKAVEKFLVSIMDKN